MDMMARHRFGADLVKVGAPAPLNNFSQPTMARKAKGRLHSATALRADHRGMMRIEEAVQTNAMETRRLIDLPVYSNDSWAGYPGSQSGFDEREARMGSQTRPKRARSQAGVTSAAHPPNPRSIHSVLRHDIVTLRLTPGEKLSENELALRFGTSRAPVREALIRLAEDGLIDVLPQRGSFVSRISLKAMERARFVREALEVAIVRRAAERGIPQDVREHAEACLEAQKEAREDPEQFTQLDDLFHRGFAEGTGLEGVWAVIEREKAQFDRIRFLSLPAGTPVDELIEQHRAILAAVLKRQPPAAEEAIRKHMSEVLKIARNLASRHPDLIMADL
jgi:GntR family transcriptional regulator, rspAB operon transcriptional repressor